MDLKDRLKLAREAKAKAPREDVTHVVRCRDGKFKRVKLTRKTAILALCTECLGWEDHPGKCTLTTCPVFPFRGVTQLTNHGDMETSNG